MVGQPDKDFGERPAGQRFEVECPQSFQRAARLSISQESD